MQVLLRKVLARVGWFAVSLLVASMLVFAILNLLPGDVAAVILGPNADAESITEMRQQLGLDRPAPARYLDWLSGLLTFDLGESALSGLPISESVASRVKVTFNLVGLGMLLAVLIALPLGMFAAVNRHNAAGAVVSGASQIGMALPAFLAGLLLVVVFAVELSWFPAGGYVRFGVDPYRWAKHLVLPVISLALVQSAILTRYVRSAFIEVLTNDYFRTARAMGWGFWRGLWRHGIRNVSIQLVTVLGLQLTTLFVGAIVVEQVFSLPGLGSFLLHAVNQRDLPVVQSVVMVLVALALLINTVVDVIYVLIDPRVRGDQP